MKRYTQPSNLKLFIAGGVLLVLAGIMFVLQAFREPADFISATQPEEIVVLYTLSTLVFVVLLVFAFILLRTLVKVWVERKQGKPGSRFKTSLLLMLGVLTLLPAVTMFAYAYGLVNRSIDKWFSGSVDKIVLTSKQIDQTAQKWQAENAQSILRSLSVNPPSDFKQTQQLLELKALLLVQPDGTPQKTAGYAGADENAIIAAVVDALGGKDDVVIKRDGDWIAAQRLPNSSNLLIAVFPARLDLAALSTDLTNEMLAYEQLKARLPVFKNTYRLILLLTTVLVLFAAVWLGLFLAKRITGPIEALAEATREISAGNLNYRVEIQAADELGMLVGLFNDMAFRLQGTTAELETRRRSMEIILENIPTGVISLDSDFNIQTLNRAARTMFSVSVAVRLEDVFKGDDLKEVQSLLAEATEAGITREVSFQTPGRPAHSAVTVSRLTAGGFVLVVEDLTEVVRAQRASAWRDVARRLAHEIRNPLTPIQLSAERISRNVARLPGPPPRVATVIQECVGAIVDEVSSLKHLVDEFVRFARLPTVARVPQSMRELVDRTLALYDGRMDGISLSVDVPQDLPLVLMDSMQMRRVLINVIDNALEAMSNQPERSLRIHCDLARDSTMARLTLEDTGTGILDEDRERLFTPYFTTRKDGTGLGLSISSRIVADHGGYIGVEPNVPRGTRFVIELPVCQESSLSTTSPASGSR
jgi:nitrogen fixation/metabolism regulation signal transduction histidine kinase